MGKLPGRYKSIRLKCRVAASDGLLCGVVTAELENCAGFLASVNVAASSAVLFPLILSLADFLPESQS